MKSISYSFILLFLFVYNIGISGGSGPQYTIEYSPTNPVVGQAVTFTLSNGDQICTIESLVPDAGNDPGNLIPFVAMYTYDTAGTYHVALDLVQDLENPQCFILNARDSKGTQRALTADFQMGPVGGPYSTAVMQGEIFCSPITIAAAPAPIPTMGQWGLIVLVLISSIIGVVYIFMKSNNVQTGSVLK